MESLKDFIAAILLEAEENGSKGVTITFLVKFLYLLDVFYADERSGEPITGLDWHFYHFGPYSEQLQHSLDDFIKSGFLSQEPVKNRNFVLLRLGAKAKRVTLDELEFPFYVKDSLKSVIRKYRFDLNGLLNYVYFRTKPMECAVPQDKLSFTDCQKVNFQNDVKPIPLSKPTAKKQKRLKELFSSMKAKHLDETGKPKLKTAPIYDEAFFNISGSNLDDVQIDEVIHVGVSFKKHDG